MMERESMENKITRAAHGRRSGSRPHGYKNGSTFKGHIEEAAELMRKVANGDVDAFDCLYDKFSPILRRLFAKCIHRHMSLDDFIQEVFTRLWQQRKNYRGTSHFLTYLLGIARYTLNEKMRQSYKMASIRNLEELTSFTLDSHDDLSQPEAKFYLKELAAAVKEAKAKLTVKQRQVLELSQTTGTSLHKASQKLGCSTEALRCRLKRARKRSRELLAPILENQ
jgi:RNA polymerase sigma factor (sigma-70 family)